MLDFYNRDGFHDLPGERVVPEDVVLEVDALFRGPEVFEQRLEFFVPVDKQPDSVVARDDRAGIRKLARRASSPYSNTVPDADGVVVARVPRLKERRCGSGTRANWVAFPKIPREHLDVGLGLLLELPPLAAVVLMEEQKQNRPEERLINQDQEPMENPGGLSRSTNRITKTKITSRTTSTTRMSEKGRSNSAAISAKLSLPTAPTDRNV